MTSELRPLRPLPYLAWGLGLFVLKIGLDSLVSLAFGERYSVAFYVSPLDAPLLSPGGRLGYWLTMWGLALPFIAAGVWLTARRLLDAGLPRGLVLLFFVPFANLIFFAACAAVPSRPTVDAPPSARSSTARGTAIVISATAGAVVALGGMAVAVGLFRSYGAALFLGAPGMLGYVTASTFLRIHARDRWGALWAILHGLVITYAVLSLAALEGQVCLLLAAIPALLTALLGGYVAFAVRGASPRAPVTLVVLPFLLVTEALQPIPAPVSPVESTVDIDASPSVVWRSVIAFPLIDEPAAEWMFRAGVAAPLSATIEGEGVGAIRRCHFTTGDFVEPITVWKPGQELTFSVRSQPDPLVERTLWHGPRPPHLDGYLASTQGQFVLEPLPGGRTRLHGRTWYRVRMAPSPYWRFWSDRFIHAIHMRVLRHVKQQAEAGLLPVHVAPVGPSMALPGARS